MGQVIKAEVIRVNSKETNLYYLNNRYYDPEVSRFISMDSIEYINPDTLNGLNLYAYCKNNPVMGIDPTGCFSWSSFWKGVGEWFSHTFGGCIKEVTQVVTSISENFFGGIEQGIQITNILGGDTKPITFYAENASSWWKIWEYKIGVSFRIDKFTYSNTMGIVQHSVSIGWGNNTIDFFREINKLCVGVSHSNGNISSYTHYYIKPINMVLAYAVVHVLGGVLTLALA